jgi:hypothetical protein
MQGDIFSCSMASLMKFLLHRAGCGRVSNPAGREIFGERANGNFAGLTRTARDVGGPCVEAFGMISENSSPLGQGRLVT